MKTPVHIPEKGFYYHYKHDPNGAINNAAYEVLGSAWNTEAVNFHSDDPAAFINSEVVIYRPLYRESLAYKAGKKFWIRPIGMFMEEVREDTGTRPRFEKITDENTIAQLEKIKIELYDN